jgi:hypothetical protein
MAKPKTKRNGQAIRGTFKTYGHGNGFEKSPDKVRDLYQGIGHFRPNSISPAAFKKTYEIWENRLASSGFQDIEYKNPNMDGRVQAYFRVNGSTATISNSFDASRQRYYELAREFNETFNFKGAFKRRASFYQYIWHLHLNGVSSRSGSKFFAGKKPTVNHTYTEVNFPPVHLRQIISNWSINKHTNIMLDLFFNWLDVEHGIKNARNTLARAIARKNRTGSYEPK